MLEKPKNIIATLHANLHISPGECSRRPLGKERHKSYSVPENKAQKYNLLCNNPHSHSSAKNKAKVHTLAVDLLSTVEKKAKR